MPKHENHENKKPPLWAIIIATGFGSGYSPIAPGSAASLLALFLGAAIIFTFNIWAMAALSLIAFFLGMIASARFIDNKADKDPSQITIDEIAAQWLILATINFSVLDYLFAFALFRFFDIVKPPPIKWFENAFSPSLNIMLDDMMAAFYVIILFQAFYLTPFV